MDQRGEITQFFVSHPEEEERVLKEFNEWLCREDPTLIAYSSTIADKPQLLKAFRRFGLPTTLLEKAFFDLYYDVINTQRERTQFIFLPMSGSMNVKKCSLDLGYNEPLELEIHDGNEALYEY